MNYRNREHELDKERAGAIRRARELVRKHVPEGVSLVDGLIEDRCWEAAEKEQEPHGYGAIEYCLEMIKKRRGIKE